MAFSKKLNDSTGKYDIQYAAGTDATSLYALRPDLEQKAHLDYTHETMAEHVVRELNRAYKLMHTVRMMSFQSSKPEDLGKKLYVLERQLDHTLLTKAEEFIKTTVANIQTLQFTSEKDARIRAELLGLKVAM